MDSDKNRSAEANGTCMYEILLHRAHIYGCRCSLVDVHIGDGGVSKGFTTGTHSECW